MSDDATLILNSSLGAELGSDEAEKLVQTIPSAASMNYNLWIMGSDDVDPTVVGEQWAKKYARGTLHTMATREQYPDAFLDVWYKDTISDPLKSMESVYQFIGMAFTDEARDAMERYREDNKRDARPAHEYTLAQFGFTESQLKEMFADYRAKYL